MLQLHFVFEKRIRLSFVHQACRVGNLHAE